MGRRHSDIDVPCPTRRPTPRSQPKLSRPGGSAKFQRLADLPPEVEWFANVRNGSAPVPSTKARDQGFYALRAGIARPEEFRIVPRAAAPRRR
jgi:hypothetical protein